MEAFLVTLLASHGLVYHSNYVTMPTSLLRNLHRRVVACPTGWPLPVLAVTLLSSGCQTTRTFSAPGYAPYTVKVSHKEAATIDELELQAPAMGRCDYWVSEHSGIGDAPGAKEYARHARTVSCEQEEADRMARVRARMQSQSASLRRDFHTLAEYYQRKGRTGELIDMCKTVLSWATSEESRLRVLKKCSDSSGQQDVATALHWAPIADVKLLQRDRAKRAYRALVAAWNGRASCTVSRRGLATFQGECVATDDCAVGEYAGCCAIDSAATHVSPTTRFTVRDSSKWCGYYCGDPKSTTYTSGGRITTGRGQCMLSLRVALDSCAIRDAAHCQPAVKYGLAALIEQRRITMEACTSGDAEACYLVDSACTAGDEDACRTSTRAEPSPLPDPTEPMPHRESSVEPAKTSTESTGDDNPYDEAAPQPSEDNPY